MIGKSVKGRVKAGPINQKTYFMNDVISKLTLKRMRGWLRALERACINRDRGKILALYETNERSDYAWDKVDDGMQEDYDSFVNRANNIVYN